jgi:hypothetical protein
MKFIVTTCHEVHEKYEVEAESQKEAEQMVLNGHEEPPFDSMGSEIVISSVEQTD